MFLLGALPLSVSAQALGTGLGSSSSFTISASPQYPLPNGTATLSFLSSSLDLSNATLRVTVGGKEIYSGSVHSVPVPLGKAGSVTTISATISAAGADYTQTLTLQPEDVILIAEPIASAPALYMGKPGVPLGGNVRVVALANLRTAGGSAISPAAVSYAWTVDGTQMANSSGIGKSALIVASPLQYRTREVSVTVTNADATLTGGASITLTAGEPAVRMYENDPLLGVRFERALSGTYAIQNSESSLFAAPFSFSTAAGAPTIQWFLDGVAAQLGSSITLRPTGSGSGQASLSVVASTGDTAKATGLLTLSFGQQASPNFFGL